MRQREDQREGAFVGKTGKRFLFSKVESRARTETVEFTFKNSEPPCKRLSVCVCVCVCVCVRTNILGGRALRAGLDI